MTTAPRFGRRELLGGLVAGTALLMAGCSGSETNATIRTADPARMPAGGGRLLIAYFSRPGENYHYGGRRYLQVGNTEILARMLADRTGGQLHPIVPVEPYPLDYDGAVERNRREQDEDVLPAIDGPLLDLAGFDTVLLGSPVWNTEAPRVMSKFLQGLDFTGKTVLPFVTYAVSGMSGIDEFYRRALPAATVTDGLSVRGEEVAEAGGAVDDWLRANTLLSS